MDDNFNASSFERLRAVVRRAFPDRSAVAEATLGPSLVEVWRQLSRAAGVDKDALAAAIAKELGLAVATNLSDADPFACRMVPESLARSALILPLREEKGVLVAAAAFPLVGGGFQRVAFLADRRVELLVAPAEDVEVAISRSYARAAEQRSKAVGTVTLTSSGESAFPADTNESAVVRLAHALMLQAIESGASDLHIQPFPGGGMVRIRVDGILRRIAFIPASVREALVRYHKAQGGMDPTNDRIPQDGRMSLILGSRDIQLRLSVLPASRGETLVIRFLDQSRAYSLGGTGFSSAVLAALRRLATHSAGVVIVTGPTGSGKSSTLYSMLAEVNRIGVNVITIENPVEYRVPGISQVEVNAKAGLTFASALRSILRQDPDIILVGEIRDRETAEIAMQAALTGHLVLTTLHTNDAISALPRLMDLGVQPTLIADAVVGVVAQRLLRAVCASCRQAPAEPLRAEEQLFFGVTAELPAYRSIGCEACRGTGFKGRFPVAEIVEMTPDLALAIAQGERDVSQLRERVEGSLKSISAGAARRVISGDTTAREAMRVLGQRFWTDLSHQFGRPVPTGATAKLALEDEKSVGTGLLLCEPAPGARASWREALEAARFDVFATADAEEARQLALRHDNIVLIIVDLDRGDGPEAIDSIRELRIALAWTRLPALLVVPEYDFVLVDLLKQHGVVDYLMDPVTPEALLSRVRAILSR